MGKEPACQLGFRISGLWRSAVLLHPPGISGKREVQGAVHCSAEQHGCYHQPQQGVLQGHCVVHIFRIKPAQAPRIFDPVSIQWIICPERNLFQIARARTLLTDLSISQAPHTRQYRLQAHIKPPLWRDEACSALRLALRKGCSRLSSGGGWVHILGQSAVIYQAASAPHTLGQHSHLSREKYIKRTLCIFLKLLSPKKRCGPSFVAIGATFKDTDLLKFIC